MSSISDTLESFFDSYMPSLSSSLRENRLERMSLLLDHLGNPEKTFKTIHIAGSKGKGSTATFLSALLEGKGYSVGLYLSPHVYDIRERFTLASRFFSDEEYTLALEELQEKLSSFSLPSSLGPEKPTTFELYTAYAYLLFKRKGCSWAVIETGLGGRLDATNTISPYATLFTPIELEHTKILGSTLTEIAREKAGIMREGVPSFSFPQREEAEKELKRNAEEIGSPLSFLSIDINKTIDDKIKIKSFTSSIVKADLYFAYTVLCLLGLIDKKDTFDLSHISLPARFQLARINTGKYSIPIVLDGAHTPDSALHLKESFSKEFTHRKAMLIFSTAQDKDYRAIADILLSFSDECFVTGLGEWKKGDPDMIYSYIKEKYPEKKVFLEKDIRKALIRAVRRHESRPIVVAGSFYLASNAKKTLEEDGLWEE